MNLRRWKRVLSVALLALNVSGTPVVAVSHGGGSSQVHFRPARSFRAIAKMVTGKQWRARGSRSLGSRTTRRSSRDLQVVQREKKMAPVAILPPINITLAAERSRNRPLYAWKLPRDRSPVQPTHLHTKK